MDSCNEQIILTIKNDKSSNNSTVTITEKTAPPRTIIKTNAQANIDEETNDKLEYEDVIVEGTETANSATTSSSDSETSDSDTDNDHDTSTGIITPSTTETSSPICTDSTKHSTSSGNSGITSVPNPVTIVQAKLSEDKLVYVKILPPTTTTHVPLIKTPPKIIIAQSSQVSPSKSGIADDVPKLEENKTSELLDESNVIKKEEIVRSSTPITTETIEVPSAPVTKMSRDLKQLKKTINASKMLSEMINDSGHTKPRKSRNLKDFDDSSYGGGGGSDNHDPRGRSRSKSQPHGSLESKSPSDMSDGDYRVRRNMRSQNIEFAQKQQKFLNRIQSHQDSDGGFNSDEESIDSSVGVKPCEDKEKKVKKLVHDIHPAPKVS